MSRLTRRTKEGLIVFHPKEFRTDEFATITSLAHYGYDATLNDIAERLARLEDLFELQGLDVKEE
jgi:NRPS condensation-like uncharacterized protein